MANRVAIVGSGQTFHKGRRLDVNGVELINEAVVAALEKTDLTMDKIDGVLIGNMDHFEGINYVDMWSIDGTGGYMKPVIKLTTGGTTGSTLAIAGYHMVASGYFKTLLVVGWEKNSESDATAAITTAFDPIWDRMTFAGAIGGLALEAQHYLHFSGATELDAARVAVRDRSNACLNEKAHLRQEVTISDVMNSPMLSDPIKELDICPRTDGACAVIFAAEEQALKLAKTPAWIWATMNRHDYTYVGDVDFSVLRSMEAAAPLIFSQVGIKEPLKELDLIEMYLPCSFSGLAWIEALGLCKRGDGPKLVNDGVTDRNGQLPINPSGGVISCNPIGATGLIRAAEAAAQISGTAGAHQIPDIKIAMSTGFGGCMWTDLLIYGKEKERR